jgi:hypothetical protein
MTILRQLGLLVALVFVETRVFWGYEGLFVEIIM